MESVLQGVLELPWILSSEVGREDRPEAAAEPARRIASAPLEQEVISLYDQHSNALYRFSMATLGDETAAQDAVQDCFLRYFAYRLAGNEVDEPKVWLLRSLRGALGRDEEKEQRREEAERESSAQAEAPFPRPDEAVARADLRKLLPGILSPRELEVMQLRAEGMQYTEIAAVMNITSGAVGAFIARAMRKLYANRHLLEEKPR